MSTYTKEERENLRLIKYAFATSTEVITPFAENKLLQRYNGSFERFLDDKKHEIFHLWQSDKLPCCSCPAKGCNLKRTGMMRDWIFQQMYDEHGLEISEHMIGNNGKVVQMCLHKYIARKIAINELDLRAISFLLVFCARLSPIETAALDTITYYRSKICEAHSIKYFSEDFFRSAWTDLENAFVNLTEPMYKKLIRHQTKCCRIVDLQKEEISELLKNLEEVKPVSTA